MIQARPAFARLPAWLCEHPQPCRQTATIRKEGTSSFGTQRSYPLFASETRSCIPYHTIPNRIEGYTVFFAISSPIESL